MNTGSLPCQIFYRRNIDNPERISQLPIRLLDGAGNWSVLGEDVEPHLLMSPCSTLPDDVQMPVFSLAIAPVVLVIALNAAFTFWSFPTWMQATWLKINTARPH